MDRHLTDEELDNSELSELLFKVGYIIDKEIESGRLKGCTLYRPCITDGPIVGAMNDVLHVNSDYMYYIQVTGTEDFMREAKVIKPLIEVLNETFIEDENGEDEGITFDTGKQLVAINSVTTKHDDAYHHMIIFLMKNADNDEDDDMEDLDTNIMS